MRVFNQRFQELAQQLENLQRSEMAKYDDFAGRTYPHIEEDAILNWAVKARSLIASACGKDSEHYRSFISAEEAQSYETNVERVKRMKAVFLATREDFEGGYLNSFRNLVQAEVAGDELEQAEELLAAGYVPAAAVVAGVVLETTLRTLSVRRGLPPASMERMNAELVKAGQYNTLVQKKITSLAAVRNSAAHGKTAEFSSADVKAMLAEVNRLVGELLS